MAHVAAAPRAASLLSSLAPGLALTGACAAAATLAARSVPGLANYQMITAILLGMAIGNLVLLPSKLGPGLAFAQKRLLRAAIILLGLQITAQQAASVGWAGLAIIAVGLLATLAVTILLGRLLGVGSGLALLIGVGTSICGASAILAAKAATHGEDEDAAYAVATVTLFGTLAILLDPLVSTLVGLDAHRYGLWTGASVHEVGQVVAAAAQGGREALEIGTIAKLARVALMAPVIIALGEIVHRLRRGDPREDAAGSPPRPPFPWFLLGFLGMVALASLLAAAPQGGATDALRDVVAQLRPVTAFVLAMAMAAMGLNASLRAILRKGARPMALAALASVFIAGLTLGLIRLFV